MNTYYLCFCKRTNREFITTTKRNYLAQYLKKSVEAMNWNEAREKLMYGLSLRTQNNQLLPEGRR